MVSIIRAKAGNMVKIFKQQNNFEQKVSPGSPGNKHSIPEKIFSQYGDNAI
jgi:hypothetical protein